MVADSFTKPLQGSQFKRFRNTILGIVKEEIGRYNAAARAYIQTLTDQAHG